MVSRSPDGTEKLCKTHREEGFDLGVLDLLFEQIVLIQEQNLSLVIRIRERTPPGESGREFTHNRRRLEPLGIARRVPEGHRVLHLVLYRNENEHGSGKVIGGSCPYRV